MIKATVNHFNAVDNIIAMIAVLGLHNYASVQKMAIRKSAILPTL